MEFHINSYFSKILDFANDSMVSLKEVDQVAASKDYLFDTDFVSPKNGNFAVNKKLKEIRNAYII